MVIRIRQMGCHGMGNVILNIHTTILDHIRGLFCLGHIRGREGPRLWWITVCYAIMRTHP